MSELLVLKKSSVFFSLFMSCIIATFHSFNSTPCIIFVLAHVLQTCIARIHAALRDILFFFSRMVLEYVRIA
jgi:hypothetical protein